MHEPQSDFQYWCTANFRQLVVSPDILRLLDQAFEGGRVAEREACAKLCDDKAKETFSGQCQVWGDYFARAIRARSDK